MSRFQRRSAASSKILDIVIVVMLLRLMNMGKLLITQKIGHSLQNFDFKMKQLSSNQARAYLRSH